MLPAPFACPSCQGALRDDGTCGRCEGSALARRLLAAGCSWCGRTHLTDREMEPGWLSEWTQERAQAPQGREPGVVCRSCWDASHTLPAADQDAFVRVVVGLPRDALVPGARP